MLKSALLLLLYATTVFGQLPVALPSIGKNCPATYPKCSIRFQEGGYCSPRFDKDFCNKTTPQCPTKPIDKFSSLMSPCHCCRNCKDIYCSKWRPGYQCSNSTAAKEYEKMGARCYQSKWLCDGANEKNCYCCPPCLDVGCSRLGPGYNCRTEKEAATWPMRCKKSKKLCQNLGGFDIAMTVDNKFKLYGGPPPTAPGAPGAFIGSGNNWPTTYTFSSGGSVDYLTIYATNDGSKDRGIILSTSRGLVTDKSWKCIDKEQSTTVNYKNWPAAKVLGPNGVGPWGPRPGISSSAQWIWADPMTPNDVVCYKEISCFCCPD